MEDLRVRRTKKMIVTAFFQLLAKEDFNRITIRQIADKAMINRQTFYLHYQDKYDLLKMVINHICQTADQILTERLNNMKRAAIDFIQAHYSELADDKYKVNLLLAQSNCSTVLTQTMRKNFVSVLKKQQNIVLTDFEARVIAANFMELILSLYTSKHMPTKTEIEDLYALVPKFIR